MTNNNKPPVVDAPPVFTDTEGRQWSIKLTVGILDDVLAQTQIDLVPQEHDVSKLMSLLFDYRSLGRVLWALVEPQAAKLQIDQKNFRNSLDKDALATGWRSVADAIIFFTHAQNPKMGEAYQRMIESELEVAEAGANQILETLNSKEVKDGLDQAAKRIGTEMKESVCRHLENYVIESQE